MDYLFASDTDILQELGQRLKVARIQAGFTQEELAQHSGVSRPTVARLEGGKNISLVNFITLLRYVDELTTFSQVLKRDLRLDPKLIYEMEQKQPQRVKHGTKG
ncbi:helix-turn-helix transcriptional regulator [uncultured Imperialibacter sp.]|uniref:helix-turn-helix domain-containing protein n=1 Tax=Imperialibacter sp. TaxID=2038411 RepID=UPI0030DD8C62|tara:strand:+ start:464 stop:775 length:312 start_codon:yes stop_codon:yes gene_type:complete